ncbi:MAG: protein kinase, partial [Pseudomonadota bacterium]
MSSGTRNSRTGSGGSWDGSGSGSSGGGGSNEAPFLLPESMVDHFQVVRLIGRGGMGEVYLARDTLLNRRVALKLVHPRYLDSEEAITRFTREAQVTASLSHPHIVTVYAVGRCEGRPYLALEYLEGQNLRQRIDEERPGVRESLRIVLAIAQALVEAHRHRVLHRDLKPENVILAKDGRLRLVDLGLAKVASSSTPGGRASEAPAGTALTVAAESESESQPAPESQPKSESRPALLQLGRSTASGPALEQSAETVVDLDAQRIKAAARVGSLRRSSEAESVARPMAELEVEARITDREAKAGRHSTVAGIVQGTPAYMAPEQWQGLECGTSTDVWSLGVMLFELLDGRRPYQDRKGEALRDAVVQAVAAPALVRGRGVSAELAELVGRCLDKDARKRPSAAELVDALERLLWEGRRHVGTEQSPFRGLFAFAERHADSFFGRDSEITVFLECLREQAVVPVVGPSGAGKSSFVHAGVIPRLREQGAWTALTVRPGAEPFAALASRLAVGESSLRMSQHVGSVFRTSDLSLPEPGSSTAGGSVEGMVAQSRSSHQGDHVRPNDSDGSRSPNESIVSIVSNVQNVQNDEEALAKRLFERPETLGLLLHELAARERCKVLLFIDQLEEVYTLVAGSVVQEAFVQAICGVADHPSSPVRAVFTIRDDFLGHLEGGSEVAAALARVFVLRRPGRESLEEVLARPLATIGYSYDDPMLVSEMVESVKNEPACLPLLQFAGQMLWDRRDKNRRLLCRAAYEAMGGVAGSLAEHADGVLAGMTPAQVELVRQLLLRLVTAAGTRRVVQVSAVAAGLGPGVDEVLDKLTQARLLTVRAARSSRRQSGGAGGSRRRGGNGDEAVLELVHESLVRTWGRLARWLEEGREDVAFLAEATQAAELWEQRGRRHEEVWQGDALRDAKSKVARLGTVAPELVVRFLDAGVRKERNARRKRKGLLSVAIVMLAGVAVASMLVAQVTSTQKERAERREAEAQREGASAARLRGDYLEARAKLRGSLETSDSTMGRVLWGELRQKPLVWSKRLGGFVLDVAFAPDGKTVAGACGDRVCMVDTSTSAMRLLRGRVGGLTSIAISPDGRRLAAGSEAGPIMLWDLEEGSARELAGHSAWVFGLAFDEDSKQLASTSNDMTVRLWDVGSAKELLVMRGHTKWGTRVAFVGTRELVSASTDGTVWKWNLETGAGRVLVDGRSALYGLGFDPVTRLLATGGGDATIRLWHTDTGQELLALHGHRDVVTAVAVGSTLGEKVSAIVGTWSTTGERSTNGRFVASGGTDKSVRLWTISTVPSSVVLGYHQDIVAAVAFSFDGKLVASSSYDGTLRLWQTGVGSGIAEENGHAGLVESLDISPDGSSLVSAGRDQTVRVWTRDGTQRALLAGHQKTVSAVSFAPDGKTLASSSYDHGVRIWDVLGGSSEELAPRHPGMVWDLAMSADGQTLVSADSQGRVFLWDANARSQSGRLQVPVAVFSVAIAPDGATVAAGTANGGVYVWDRVTRQLEAELHEHERAVDGLAFTPDGRALISGGQDGTVRRWDLSSRVGAVLDRHGARVWRVSVSSDGRLLAIPCDDGTIRLRELATGKARTVLRGHRGGVRAFRFAADGQLAASCGDDATVRTWDVEAGRPYWRAPLVLRAPPRIVTHLGWIR